MTCRTDTGVVNEKYRCLGVAKGLGFWMLGVLSHHTDDTCRRHPNYLFGRVCPFPSTRRLRSIAAMLNFEDVEERDGKCFLVVSDLL